MQALTVRVAQNGYIVRAAAIDAASNEVKEVQGEQYHIFDNLDDLKYYVGLKLDAPVGES